MSPSFTIPLHKIYHFVSSYALSHYSTSMIHFSNWGHPALGRRCWSLSSIFTKFLFLLTTKAKSHGTYPAIDLERYHFKGIVIFKDACLQHPSINIYMLPLELINATQIILPSFEFVSLHINVSTTYTALNQKSKTLKCLKFYSTTPFHLLYT